MTQKRSPITRVLLIVAAALLTAEIICTVAGAPLLPPSTDFIEAQEWRYADWIEKDRDLFWRYRPSQIIDGRFMKPGRYTINGYGYRGTDYALEKPGGVTRVVCLGESTTFGLGVSDSEAWPHQMEVKLNAIDPQRRRWEVLNLGVTNYSTFQGVRQAREELPRLEPDVVMSCFSWADHQPAANGVADDRISTGPDWKIVITTLANRSAAVRWLRAGWATIAPAQIPEEAPPGFEQRRVSSTEFSENIEKLMREAIAVGARPITITSPISWPPEGLSDTSSVFHIHHRYRRLARFGAIAGGGEFVELANAFDQHANFYDDIREENELFNAQGHAFAGEFLARYLLGDSVIVARYGSQMYTDER